MASFLAAVVAGLVLKTGFDAFLFPSIR
jgi:hypothetical protein